LNLSKNSGISLIVIPYWWNHSEDFLRAKIAEQRPDLVQHFVEYSITEPVHRQQPDLPYSPVTATTLQLWYIFQPTNANFFVLQIQIFL
jgi:hypothetical protein